MVKTTLLVLLAVSTTICVVCKSPGDCNFEADFCNWMNDTSDDFDWLRHTGPTETLFTGPSGDHTTGKGFYIYNNANDKVNIHEAGDKAKLISPSMRGPKCMTFYYNMYGEYMSCILVLIRVENGTQYLAWIKSGDRGDRWIEAQVFINQTGNYQVILEVIQNWSWSGQGAIDDISFHNGTCQKNDDIFYVSKTSNPTVAYKVGTMPPYGDWIHQFSFSARKTTDNLQEPMYFVYPSLGYGHPLISRKLILSPSRFPLDFFYDSVEANTSSVFHVIRRGSPLPEQISAMNSSYEHCCDVQGITSFSAIPVEDENLRCSEGWIGVQDWCFYFNIEEVRTWDSARKKCRTLGGDLLIIDTLEKLANLTMKMLDKITLGVYPYYVGLRDTVTNVTQQVKWINGLPVDGRLWKKGQPQVGGGTKCGVLTKDSNELLLQPCSTLYGFICESKGDNIAPKLPVNSSSAISLASFAVDNNPDNCFYSHKSSDPWLSIRLPEATYIHAVKIINHKGCCNIPRASMEVIVQQVLHSGLVLSRQCGRNQPFGGNVLSRDFECRPPTFGNHLVIRLHGDNVTLVLCQVHVAAFDSVDEVKGIHRQIWYKLINTQGMSSIRENIVFNSAPQGATVLPDFESDFEVADNYGQLLTSFLQVPSGGNYSFHLSCDNECELWIKEYHEDGLLLGKGGMSSDVGRLLVRIQKWAGYNDSLGCVNATTASKIYLTKCRVYEMKLYMKEGSSFQCLAVGMTTPNGSIQHPIKNSHLFWMQPGQRILRFKVLGSIIIEADLGEAVSIKARYSFCCQGIHCPNCSLTVEFHVFGKVYDVNQSLKASCEEQLFTVQLDAVVQPGLHKMKILYGFLGTLRKDRSQRTVGQINVKVAVLQNETFTKGFGKWKATDLQPGWKTGHANLSKELSVAFIDGPHSSSLLSHVLPWKPFYSQVGLCLKFSYLMPKLQPATLKFFLNVSGEESLQLWSLNGFHGEHWHSARVSWQARKNSVIVIRGESTVSNALSIAIDTITITTEACTLHPSYAAPDFSCSEDEFQCANGQCISKNQRCDNDRNCLDNSDEIGCKCLVNELTCPSGTCVDSRKLCDGTEDCEDGLDEKRCGGGKCGMSRFPCPEGRCLTLNSTCSKPDVNKEHCLDKSNIPSVCGTSFCPLNKLNCREGVSKVDKKCKYSFRGLCTFENGFCGLKHDNATNIQWTIGTGSTPSHHTGPKFDHSTWSQQGSYIFIETSQRNKGDKARMSSDWMNPGSAVCLHFWYHMYGIHIGALNVILKTPNSKESVIWSMTSNQGNKWLLGQVGINVTGKFQFIIEGVRGPGNKGDIAVDDVTLLEGHCIKVLEPVSPDCAFEEDTCQWQDDGYWLIQHVEDGHIKENGDRGRYLELKDKSTGQTHNMTSADLRNTNWSCLRFWYFIGLGYLGNLRVGFVTNESYESLWSSKKNSRGWSYVQVPIDTGIWSYKVVFQGSSTGPVVALDDVSFSEVPCYHIPHSTYTGFIPPPVPKCSQSLGMQNYKIPDSRITASSSYRDRTAARRGRLFLADRFTSTLYTGGWCKGYGTRYPWLMVDLGQDMYVTMVATQGKQELDFWVKTYYLRYKKKGQRWQWYYRNGELHQFIGNFDRHTPVYNHLDPVIVARYIRIYPWNYKGLRCLRVDYFGCPVVEENNDPKCDYSLGIQKGRVPDASITASSSLGSPHRARLYTVEEGGRLGAWVPESGDDNPWLQIDFGTVVMVTKIATQGRHGNFGENDHYVKKYSLSYSQTGIAFDWYKVNGNIKVYKGNRDRAAVVYKTIDPSIIGRYVRVHPVKWHTRPAIRLDMYGCVAVKNDISKIENLGCFKGSSPPAIPSLENIDKVLEGNYHERSGAILRCAEAAYKRGFEVFATQNGKCLSSSTTNTSFSKYGRTNACGIDGRGGVSAYEVYRIIRKCDKDDELRNWKENHNSNHAWVSRNKANETRAIRDDIMRTNHGDSSSIDETVVLFSNGTQMTSRITFHPATSFSLCFWVKCTHPGIVIALEGSAITPILISQSYCRFEISILGETGTADQCICDDRWHHVCFTWKSHGGVWEMYVDGRLRSFSRWLSGLKKLPALDFLTISYSKSSYSTASHKQLQLTNFNVWHGTSSPQEVLRMSYGCGGNGLHGDVISWNQLLTTMTGNYSLSKSSSCFFEKGGILLNSSLSSTIASPWFDRSDEEYGKCMKFRYFIYGQGTSLEIFQSVFGDKNRKKLWMDGNKTKAVWNYGQISVAAVSKTQITVKGQFTKNSSDLVAIGGVYFTDGYCHTLPARAAEACNVLLTNLSGDVTSLLYPSYYPNKTSCKWTISVPKGNIIILSSLVFSLEPHSRCKKDYLEVYDGTPDSSTMIGRYCGEAFPSRIESSSNVMTLVFRSNRDVTRKGFRFSYEAKAQTEDMSCGKNQDVCPTSCRCFHSSGNTNRLVVQGDSLLSVPRNIPKQSAVIFFQGNKIYQLKKDVFSSLPSLEYVDISNNLLLRVEDQTFSNLPKIQDIKLSTNFISSLSSKVFHGLPSLRMLDLSENIIQTIDAEMFSALKNLTVLSLRSNHIVNFHPDIFKNTTHLQYLYLQHNRIEALPDGIFRNLRHLKVLYLNNNQLKKISFGAFRGLDSLQTLFLQSNKFSSVTPKTFKQMKNLKVLKLDHFTLCCYAVKAISGVDCESPVDEFSSCNDLMKNKGLQICIWILGSFAFLGNIGVIIWRVLTKEDNKVHSFLLTNLAISDFLMGVYLLIIAIKDAQWQGEYFKKDYEWRNGVLCQLTGALSMLSSEVSVLMLTLITADRFASIVFAMKFGKLSYRKAVTMCMIIWAFGLIISLLPLTRMDYFHDAKRGMGFYGRSSVCLPLQLSSSRPAGWQYSVSFYIALNFVSFMFILVAYVMMFWTVKRSSNKARSTNAKKEARMARKLLFIVLTDFCCWMPVILIGIFSLTGNFHDPQGLAYVWIAVFVLPVNSSINPILYTFSNANVKIKIMEYGKTLSTSYAINSMVVLSARDTQQDGSASTTDHRQEETRAVKPAKGLRSLNRKIGPIVQRKKIKLMEICDIFTTRKPKGMVYVTCWIETSQCMGLLKIFGPGKQKEWMKEINVLNQMKTGRDHDNLMNYKWHAKANILEIDHNNISIPGIPLYYNCRIICFDFSASSQSLARFLGESGFNANIESLFILSVDVLKAVEHLHHHEVCHGDINPHTIVIGKFRRFPPIKAFVGGFDKASVVKSGTKADEAYKSDIVQVGNLMKQMLDSCGYTEDYGQISVIIDMCFQDSFIWRRRAKEIRTRLEQIWITSNERDSCV